ATLQNRQATADERRRALQVLAARQREELVGSLPSLLGEPALRIDAIRAVAAYDDQNLGAVLLSGYDSFNADEKREALIALSARPRYGRMLTAAIRDKKIPRADVPVYVARQLRRVV